MRRRLVAFVPLLVSLSAPAAAQVLDGGPLSEVPDTVYGEPPLQTLGGGLNEGAAELLVRATLTTDYVFRGFEPIEPEGSEDTINFGFDATLSFDLGRLPDPFVRIITNTSDSDNFTDFGVIRPIVGVTWQTEAFDLQVGHQSFTYPDRGELNTAEVFVDLHLNDAVLGGQVGRVLGPFVFAAYDYDTFDGTYLEVGLRREVQVPDTSLTLGYRAHVAYVDRLEGLFGGEGSGFPHYQISGTARYDLNTLLNISRRFGRWSVEANLNYTDGIDQDLLSETQLWGGGGVVFRY